MMVRLQIDHQPQLVPSSHSIPADLVMELMRTSGVLPICSRMLDKMAGSLRLTGNTTIRHIVHEDQPRVNITCVSSQPSSPLHMLMRVLVGGLGSPLAAVAIIYRPLDGGMQCGPSCLVSRCRGTLAICGLHRGRGHLARCRSVRIDGGGGGFRCHNEGGLDPVVVEQRSVCRVWL